MQETDGEAPSYIVERFNDGQEQWRIVGPNGVAGVFRTERDAQARADFLNEQAAEEREDDA
jgi:hypothetical protein